MFFLVRGHKGFKFRIYPSDKQEERLLAWESALRFLWNLALEQRKLGLARPVRLYPNAFDQINELKALCAELPFLADVPRNVCAQLLVELDKAWQRCFKRIARAPRWKRKGRDSLGLTEPHSKVWRLVGNTLRFPKLGKVRAVVHRPLEGKPKSCTIRRDGDQWFVSIVCEIELPDPVPRIEPVVALDRGITHLIADSDGTLVENPKPLEAALKRLARAQRVVSRRKKGSNNRKKAVSRVNRLHRKIRRQRDHVLHTLSAAYAKSHGTVVVERLQTANMLLNHSLARRIADAGWSRLVELLRYKLAWSGGRLVEVPAALQLADLFRLRSGRRRVARPRVFPLYALWLRRPCRPQRCESSEKPCESLGSACGGSAARGHPSKQESGEASCSTSFSTKPGPLGRG